MLNVESTSTDSYLAANVCRLATCLYLLASVLVYHSYRLSTLIGLWHFLDFNIAVSVCNLHHIKFHKLKRHFLYLCLMLSGRNCFSYDNKQRNTSRICTFWWHWGKDEIIILRFSFMWVVWTCSEILVINCTPQSNFYESSPSLILWVYIDWKYEKIWRWEALIYDCVKVRKFYKFKA